MKPGAAVVIIALVISACAGFGGSTNPGLTAICSHREEAAAVNFLLGNSWAPPPDQDGTFSVPIDRAPLLGRDRATDDADAAAIIERLGTDRPRFVRGYEEWLILSRTDEGMLLGGIESHSRTLRAMVHATPSDDGGWTRRFARDVRCGVDLEGSDSLIRQWHLDPQVEPDPSNSELAIRFYEGCPDELAGWAIVPVVFTNDEVVMITITVTAPPDIEPTFCNLGSAFSWPGTTVDVGEPIGNRILVDGSSFPMQPRSWPPQNFLGR